MNINAEFLVLTCESDSCTLQFSNKLNLTYRRTTDFVATSLYFSFANQYALGGGFRFQ
jgi:hypothetical protein